jgi:hypothetical protein
MLSKIKTLQRTSARPSTWLSHQRAVGLKKKVCLMSSRGSTFLNRILTGRHPPENEGESWEDKANGRVWEISLISPNLSLSRTLSRVTETV